MGKPGRAHVESVAAEYRLDPLAYLSGAIFQGEKVSFAHGLKASTRHHQPPSPDCLDAALANTLSPLIHLERAIAERLVADPTRLTLDRAQYNLTGNAVREALTPPKRSANEWPIQLGSFVIELINPDELPDTVREEVLYNTNEHPAVPMSQLALELRANTGAVACALGIQLRLDERRPQAVSLTGMAYRLPADQ